MYEQPVLGGQREIAIGLVPRDTEYQGFYVNQATAFAQTDNNGTLPNGQVTNFKEQRVGWMSWSVAKYPFQNKPAILLQTEGLYNQVIQNKVYKELHVPVRAKRSYWLTPEGEILQVVSRITTSSGIWSMVATFHKDSYDLYLNDPRKGERILTMNPACCIDGFNAMFKPMMKDDQVLQRTKEFWQVNPVTGAPEKFTATLGGRFTAHWFNNTRYDGRYLEIEGPGVKQRAYITYEGAMMKVELSNKHYLNVEEKPVEKPHIFNKGPG